MRFAGGKKSVVDGPFAETKELIAGYWIFQTRSLQECVDWVKRCPNPMLGESEIEIRPLFETEDFQMSDETKALHDQLAAELHKAKA